MAQLTYDTLTSRLTPTFTNSGLASLLGLMLDGTRTLHLFKSGPDDPFSYDITLLDFEECDYLGYSSHVLVDPGTSDEWAEASAEKWSGK